MTEFTEVTKKNIEIDKEQLEEANRTIEDEKTAKKVLEEEIYELKLDLICKEMELREIEKLLEGG